MENPRVLLLIICPLLWALLASANHDLPAQSNSEFPRSFSSFYLHFLFALLCSCLASLCAARFERSRLYTIEGVSLHDLARLQLALASDD